ncbi:hypothetical protein VTN00DRAFT_1515 [Thermoascus crustaceus]|uniref:uncharacterized protein n=1 Tax=Thermoascus crustaceus TaxID=5088 RepID=UPI0037426B45
MLVRARQEGEREVQILSAGAGAEEAWWSRPGIRRGKSGRGQRAGTGSCQIQNPAALLQVPSDFPSWARINARSSQAHQRWPAAAKVSIARDPRDWLLLVWPSSPE